MSNVIERIQNLLSTSEETDPFEVPMEERSDYPVKDGIPRIPEEDLIGVFPRDSGWGNKITFDDFEERRCHGWMTVFDGSGFGRHVKKGDLFGYQASSGNVMVFRLINIERPGDPGDMFYADALDIGYMEE